MLTHTEAMKRVCTMQKQLQAKGIDGALFIFPIDVYYFSGTRQNSTLWIPASGEPVLLVRKSLARARVESVLADIRPFPSSKEFPALFGETVRTIGFTFDVAPVQQLNYYTKLLPGREFVDVSAINREVRSVKSSYELDQLRRSGASLCSVFRQVPEFLAGGMRELDLAAEFEHRLRLAGNEGFIRMRAFNQELFMGLALSGGAASYGFFDGAVTGRGLSNASPQGASLQVIKANEPIFFDYTGVFNGYITDMTRIFVMGTLDPELQRAFELSLEIQEHIRAALKPGVICEELFLQSVELAEKGGLGAHFMGMPGEQAKFVGHGVGLELDEFPVLAQGFKVPLQVGQAIAVEPKFVFPDKGVIGIENTYAVTVDGGEKITDIADDLVYL
ncbi:MAG: Xaa-Pro peptidase family protein [Desulfuromonadaceae bacterium]|nr:Xaa-Pro peptidase family protein [Desulfuromonadaceae bacterium]MDD5105194.1 Xaa-Pro peptidase family protein [Desulfuromonadaceae bacterium]